MTPAQSAAAALERRAAAFDADADHLTRPARFGESPRPVDGAAQRARVARAVADTLRDVARDVRRLGEVDDYPSAGGRDVSGDEETDRAGGVRECRDGRGCGAGVA